MDDYWKKVIFTDECKVMIDGKRRVYIWKQAGEEWDTPCIAVTAGRRLDLMIWGCINYKGVGTLCVVDGNINSQKYKEIIDNHRWLVVAACVTVFEIFQFYSFLVNPISGKIFF